jgi:hypothetical protein
MDETRQRLVNQLEFDITTSYPNVELLGIDVFQSRVQLIGS